VLLDVSHVAEQHELCNFRFWKLQHLLVSHRGRQRVLKLYHDRRPAASAFLFLGQPRLSFCSENFASRFALFFGTARVDVGRRYVDEARPEAAKRVCAKTVLTKNNNAKADEVEGCQVKINFSSKFSLFC